MHFWSQEHHNCVIPCKSSIWWKVNQIISDCQMPTPAAFFNAFFTIHVTIKKNIQRAKHFGVSTNCCCVFHDMQGLKWKCHVMTEPSHPSRGTQVSPLLLTPHGATSRVCSKNHKDTENQVRLVQVQHDADQSILTLSCKTITPQSQKKPSLAGTTSLLLF